MSWRGAATTSWSQRLPRMAMTSPGPRSTPQMPRSPTSSPLARRAIWRPSVERNSRSEEIIQIILKSESMLIIINLAEREGRMYVPWFPDWLLHVFLGHSGHGGRQAERDLPQLPPHLWDQRRQAYRGKHTHLGFYCWRPSVMTAVIIFSTPQGSLESLMLYFCSWGSALANEKNCLKPEVVHKRAS